MNFKKILLAAVVASCFITTVMAEEAVVTLNGSVSNTLAVIGPAKLLNITIQSNSQTNGLISFFDSPYLTNTYITGAFTNITKTIVATNIVYTNIFGVISTNSFSIARLTTNTLTGPTLTRQNILSATTVSNTVASYDFFGVHLANGLLITNIGTLGGAPGNVTINISYQEFK